MPTTKTSRNARNRRNGNGSNRAKRTPIREWCEPCSEWRKGPHPGHDPPLDYFELQDELAQHARGDDGERAFQVAMLGIRALAGDPAARANCRKIAAVLAGPRAGNSVALAIVWIADRVETAVAFRRPPDDKMTWQLSHKHPRGKLVPRDLAAYREAAPNAPAQLRAALVARFDNSVPDVADLAEWLDSHGPKHKRGVLTTAGVVGRIVHRIGQPLEVGQKHTEAHTIDRVRRVLERTPSRDWRA